MSLGDLQRALGTLVVAHASGAQTRTAARESLQGLDLTSGEQSWIRQLVPSRGFEVTCYIQRWWRQTRLQWTVRLTLAALAPEKRAELIDSYLDAAPSNSLFFIPEALGFLDFVIGVAPMISHLDAIARFERAILIATESAPWSRSDGSHAAWTNPNQTIRCNPAADVVEFTVPPEELLGALLKGEPLPSPSPDLSHILVAPGLPDLWRLATAEEAYLFSRCKPSCTVERLLTQTHGDEQLLDQLLNVGALCPDGDFRA